MQKWVDEGELAVVAVTQEQQSDRCRLFAAWQELDYPILHDPINVRDLITHRYPYTEAPEVYRLLGEAKTADYDAKGDVHRDMIGVVFDWQR